MSDYIRDIPYIIETSKPQYTFGEAGCAGYTTVANSEGNYYSFFCKPAGKGARTASPEYFKYVDRKTSKRKSRAACKRRSYNLAHGKPVTHGVKPAKRATMNDPGMGYCAKCKETHIMRNAQNHVATGGRAMIKGSCIQCGTTMQKFGTLIDCPECGTLSEGTTNDYICKGCRAATNTENLRS